jgi:hypothetical protein
MRNEYRLILNMVLKNRTLEEEKLLNKIFMQELNWEIIGGQLVNHRLGGYFLSGLSKESYKNVPYELVKTLELIVIAQEKQTLEIIRILKPILEEFEAKGLRYAGLKGIIFNAYLYNPGDRRSNDTDILVYENDLDKLDEILRNYGYIQTFMENGEYKEASRKVKLIQRMNYHDLVPYVKLFDNEFIKIHEIDINFHFDSKENDITLNIFEKGTELYQNEFYSVRGLPWETNLAHLCVHFFREATNSIWTSGKRDVTLYKIVDIINAIRSCKEEDKITNWPDLMKSLKLEKAAYYTLFVISQFYEDEIVKSMMDRLSPKDDSFLYEIKIEGQNRVEKRSESFVESAFDLSFKR